MNILITGFPGLGKSAIAKELKSRGYNAYDPQSMRSFMHTEDRVTGTRIRSPAEVPSGWYDERAAFNWDIAKIEKLLSLEGDVFICSKAHNQASLYHRFHKIFVLILDETILEKRLIARAGAIGKTAQERSDILRLHKQFESSLIELGAIPIDVSAGIKEVAEQILLLSFHR